jgi:hypothetical protein
MECGFCEEHKTDDIKKLYENIKNANDDGWRCGNAWLVVLDRIVDILYRLNTEEIDKIEEARTCMEILKVLISSQRGQEFFLKAKMEYYIYPFLLEEIDEEIRISTLELFGILLKDGMPESMKGGELIPLLLKIVDSKSEKIQELGVKGLWMVLQGNGLDYAVQTTDRFHAIDIVLRPLMNRGGNILKTVLKIYIQICKREKVREKITKQGFIGQEIQKLDAENAEIGGLKKQLLGLIT